MRALPVRCHPGFCRCVGGTSAVEFALVLPIMLVILLSGYEFSRMSAVSRKVTLTTRAIADLTTQNVALATSDLDTILAASAQIFSPYSTSSMTVVVSQLSVSALGIATVSWSRSLAGSTAGPGLPTGTVETVPAAMLQPSSYLVWCTVSYTYVPPVSTVFGLSKTLSDQIYMSPRLSNSIALSG